MFKRLILWVGFILIGTGGQAHAQLTEVETRVLDLLNVERVEKQIEFLSTGIVKNDSGAGAGTATGGTQDEAKIASYVEAELRKIGLATHQESFHVRHYEYGPVTLHFDGVKLPAISVGGGGGTWGTKDGVPYHRGSENTGQTVRAPAVYVAGISEAEFQKVGDVRRRVVLMGVMGRIAAPVLQAAYHGAVALVVFRISGNGDKNPAETMAQEPSGYHDQIPTVIVSEATGLALAKKIKTRTVIVDLENRIDSEDGSSSNVIATIKGTQFPDEYIMVSSHYDRWWQSANDNEAGTAAMIEIARVIAAGHKPKRSIMFVSTGSEEFGRADTQVDYESGSAAFIASHPDVMRRLVYDRNFDLAGWTSARGTMLSSPEIVDRQAKVIADLGLADRISTVAGQDVGTDAWNFGAVGGGATSLLVYASEMLSHNAAWDPKVEPDPFWQYSHTQQDRFQHKWYLNLSDELRISALSVMRMDDGLDAPVNLPAVAHWTAQNLDADAKQSAPALFARAMRSVSEFRSAAEAAELVRGKVADIEHARIVNAHLLNIRRDLMPWLYANADTSFRTGAIVKEIDAITRAKSALGAGDKKAALAALASIRTVGELSAVAPSVEQRLRIDFQTSNDSGLVYRHYAPYPSSELVDAYRSLQRGVEAERAADLLTIAHGQLAGQLKDSLAIMGDKLDRAVEALNRTSNILR